jgi:DNA end-binding protein Ku
MAAPRPYWKGYLRLSLVSISVELYPALASAHHPTVHQIHRPSGRRIHYEKVVPGVGVVEPSEITRGVEIAEDTYAIVEPEELEKIRLQSRHTIDLVQFVGKDEIDPRYFERPYYLVPGSDVSTEGYQIIRAALRAESRIGLGQLAMRGQEYLVAVQPLGKGLLLETLHYADEVRKGDPLFEGIAGDEELDREKIDLARRLIRDKAAPFDPSLFKDHYGEALRALITRKQGAKKIVRLPEEKEARRPAEVVDLMAALKRSVAGQKRQAARRARPHDKTSVVGRRHRRQGEGS